MHNDSWCLNLKSNQGDAATFLSPEGLGKVAAVWKTIRKDKRTVHLLELRKADNEQRSQLDCIVEDLNLLKGGMRAK